MQSQHTSVNKKLEGLRKELENDTRAFLENGGKINYIKPAVRALKNDILDEEEDELEDDDTTLL